MMPHRRAQSSQLAALGDRLKRRLGNQRLAEQALVAVTKRAPDERLALAFLLKLAEDSPTALKNVLRDRAAGEDLIFCLGSSELIATELSSAGARWDEVFLDARDSTLERLLAAMQHERPSSNAPDRQVAAAELGRFMRLMRAQVAIADLLDRIVV